MNLRLSEAIRLGSMMKPQAFEQYFNDERTASCALGAALDAVGGTETCEDELWPYLHEIELRACPQCEDGHRVEFGAIIPHLNDDHRWTREAIAAWVSEIEQQQEKANAAETVGSETAISY